MSVARAVSYQLARKQFTLIHDLFFLPKPRVMQSNKPRTNLNLNLHHAITRDVSGLFKAHERDEQSEAVRIAAFERLRKLIHGIGDGGEYDLVHTSFDSMPDIPRFYHAPLECAILDTKHRDGLQPIYGNAALPTAYDSISLAKYLSENGYNGTFIDTKPDLLGYDSDDPDTFAKPPPLPTEPAWGQLSTPSSSIYNVLPPTLRIKSNSLDTNNHPEFEIHLNPAHPIHELRWNLLRRACQESSSFRLLSSFFWLWLRSHGIEQFSWMTSAFLIMFYLQDRYQPPDSSPQNPIAQSLVGPPPQEVWNRIECGSEAEYERLAVPPVSCVPDPLTHPGSLIYDFFVYWVSNKYLPGSRVLDPLTGSHDLRLLKYKGRTKDLDEVQAMKELKTKAKKGLKEAYWEYHPLVLRDPVLPTHNLAHTVTEHALQLMIHKSQEASRILKRGLPLTEILGSSALPPLLSNQVEAVAFGIQTQPSVRTLSSGMGTVMGTGMSMAMGMQGAQNLQRIQMYHTKARKEATHTPIGAPPYVNRSVREAREKTINRVQSIVRGRYGNQYSVECFGSTQYGVDSPTSDLDLVILDEERKTGFTPDVDLQSLPAVYNVRNLAGMLERKGFRIIRVVLHASVPIVKFEDPRTRLNCDINVNDRLGLFNTHLIGLYCSLSPLLRPLLMMLKKWAKSLGLNDPSGEGGTTTFSSYALTLMTVGFLQAHELLPNLQADLPPLTPEEEFWICWKDGRRTRCDPRFNRSAEWTVPSNILIRDLRGALIAWFRFWGHQYTYALSVMSIRSGGVVPRAQKPSASITAEKQAKKRAKKAERNARRERKEVEEKARKAFHEARVKAREEAREEANVVQGVGAEGAEPGGGGEREGALEKKNNEAEAGADKSQGAIENEEAEEADENVEDSESPAVDDVEEAALEEMDEADLSNGRQPSSWATSTLVVADPFILAKNVTGSITPLAIARFTSECRRSLLLLSAGAEFDDILGDGSAIGRSGRKRRDRKGKAINEILKRVERDRALERRYVRSKDRPGQKRSASTSGNVNALKSRTQSVDRERERERERTKSTSRTRVEAAVARQEPEPENFSRSRSQTRGPGPGRPPSAGASEARQPRDNSRGSGTNGKKKKYHSGRWRPERKSPGRWTQRSMEVLRQTQAEAASPGP